MWRPPPQAPPSCWPAPPGCTAPHPGGHAQGRWACSLGGAEGCWARAPQVQGAHRRVVTAAAGRCGASTPAQLPLPCRRRAPQRGPPAPPAPHPPAGTCATRRAWSSAYALSTASQRATNTGSARRDTSSRQPSVSAAPPPPREHSTYILRMQTCAKLLLVVACAVAREVSAPREGDVAQPSTAVPSTFMTSHKQVLPAQQPKDACRRRALPPRKPAPPGAR